MAGRNDFDREVSGDDDFDWRDDDISMGSDDLLSEENKAGKEDRDQSKGTDRNGNGQAGETSDQTLKEQADEKPRGEEKPLKKRHRFGWIIPVVLIAVFAFSFYKFLSQYLTYQQAINEYKEMDSMISEVPADSSESDTASSGGTGNADTADSSHEIDESAEPAVPEPDYPKLSIDFDGLSATNPEFIGVISIPALDLKYPVAQTEDNDKYLHTTFEGTNNASGCIFLDCNATADFGDWNTYIFGHNMRNQTMFGSLKRFINEEGLCDTDPYVYIYVKNKAGDTVREQVQGETVERTLEQDEERVLVYRIFAYYTIPVNDDVYDDFEGDDGYDAYVADAENHSLYTLPDGVIDWSGRPDLLTLSTCYATGHVNNFIVQGALVGIAHEKM